MKILLTSLLLSVLNFTICEARVWTVNPNGEYDFCSEVSSLVADGDTIEIESGLYENDRQVSWKADNLLIRGIHGKPELKAGSKISGDNSNGKGIFVIHGNNTTIENIKFTNSKVVDHNGAGIRQEGKNLIVRHCTFEGNEMGILQGGTISDCKIVVEFCEFLNSGSPQNPGYQHNIYINHIDTLIFRYNSSIDAIAAGHEFKSRANNSYILYNRISNINSVDSRNIDIPNGGTAVILGNIIEQGENSENSGIIGFGLEGLVNPGPHNLWICSNTIVNKKSKGNFINVADIDSIFLKNNIMVGAKTGGFITGNPALIDSSNNFINDDIYSTGFIDADIYNYHLSFNSPAIDEGVVLDEIVGPYSLNAKYEYKEIADFKDREYLGKPDLGAFEFDPTIGIREDNLINDFQFTIYPNPSEGISNIILFLPHQSDVEIYISDILGSVLMRRNYSSFSKGLHELSVFDENLCPGIYHVTVSIANGVITKSMVILK